MCTVCCIIYVWYINEFVYEGVYVRNLDQEISLQLFWRYLFLYDASSPEIRWCYDSCILIFIFLIQFNIYISHHHHIFHITIRPTQRDDVTNILMHPSFSLYHVILYRRLSRRYLWIENGSVCNVLYRDNRKIVN